MMLSLVSFSSLQFHQQGKIEPRSIPRHHRQHNKIKAKDGEKVISEQKWNRLQVCPLQDLLPLPKRKAEDHQRTATNKHSAHLLSGWGHSLTINITISKRHAKNMFNVPLPFDARFNEQSACKSPSQALQSLRFRITIKTNISSHSPDRQSCRRPCSCRPASWPWSCRPCAAPAPRSRSASAARQAAYPILLQYQSIFEFPAKPRLSSFQLT